MYFMGENMKNKLRLFFCLFILNTCFSWGFGMFTDGNVPKTSLDGSMSIQSKYSVPDTMDQFEKVIRSEGYRVLERIDYQRIASLAGESIAPIEVIRFTKPGVLVPILIVKPIASLGFPLEAAVWTDKEKNTILTWFPVMTIVKKYEISEAPVLLKHLENVDEILLNMVKEATQ